jgi:glycosyltransferase involved in cell wall biosynthesis/SAM-dependent methyltransferase
MAENDVTHALPWTGERFLPEIEGDIALEHLHRYAVAAELADGKDVLDIACGEGYGSALLSVRARRVVGVDIAYEAIAHASRKYDRPNARFVVGTCRHIPLADHTVDLIVSFETIEHVAEHEDVIAELKRVLRPGGLLVISSPDKYEYSDVPGYSNPYHVKELYRHEFSDLIRRSFRHLVVAGQRVVHGSGIFLEDVSAPVETLTRVGDAFGRSKGLHRPRYLIALASDDEFPPLVSSLLEGWQVERVPEPSLSEAQLAERDADLAASREEAVGLAREVEGLKESVAAMTATFEAQRAAFEQAIAGRQAAIHGRIAEITTLRQSIAAFEVQAAEIFQSSSWRLTKPLRWARSQLSARPSGRAPGAGGRRPGWSARALSAYRHLPLSVQSRVGLKDVLFRSAPWLFRGAATFRAWDLSRKAAERLREPDLRAGVVDENRRTALVSTGGDGTLPAWFYEDVGEDYIPIATRSAASSRIRAIAFYLPQFHPIPENDRWWGKGFTEWSNVSRAKPQFEGHYQPRLPGELGFYDLRILDIQRRQIELAKLYGLSGFCYHHYWFGGTRLLSQPLDQLLAHPELDFPFCLCWANENWSRRWDGLEEEVLIAQRHSPEDDLAFIRDIAPALADPRYIRIDGRPLLIVYRPALLPDARATAERWRAYCRDAGIGDLYLVSTQAFDRRDPHEFGFDAAMEFAPNNLGVSPVSSPMPHMHSQFRGAVYDYRQLLEFSRHYQRPDGYDLFRSVTPMWDNEPRRTNRGTVFVHSSPARYGEWLENACRYTEQHLGPDRPLVFINAWNEWAESAYLEPDRRFGYAYLQATADALSKFPVDRREAPVVVVSHDAYFHGAQRVALTLAQTLAGPLGYRVETLLCGDGPLRPQFEAVGPVHDFYSPSSTRQVRERIVRDLAARGARAALCNTSVVGDVVELLKTEGFSVVSMVHELPGLIKAHGLDASIERIACYADRVVFPAVVVREKFRELTGMPRSKALVRPQGLLAPNRFKGRWDTARRELRSRLGLPEHTAIVLAVGYADHRKGLDLFIEAGLRMLERRRDVTFVWVGHHDVDTFSKAQERLAVTGRGGAFLFPGLVEGSDVFFAGADVYLMTSREDPFPLVVLDALDAELPVVGFDGAGGFVELLARGCGVLVPYLDVAAMAAAAERLLTDYEERDRIALEGRRIIDDEFDFSDYARCLISLALSRRPSVSVIVPNYNYADHLSERLHSILNQTYRPCEILFLDDCSTDGSIEVAEPILRQGGIPYRILRNETNQGCYPQWLRGLREACGDLVWIAEADDHCAPTLLESLVPAFARDAVVLAYCQSKQVDEQGRELAPDYLQWTADLSATKWRAAYTRRGADEIRDSLAVKNTIPNVSAALMRRPDLSAIESTLIDLRNAGDWLVYVHVLERGEVAYIPQNLNYHRRHGRSVTIGHGGLNLMRETLLVQQYVSDRHAIAPDVERKRSAHLQTIYEHLGLDRDGPAAYQEHPTLRPLVKVARVAS